MKPCDYQIVGERADGRKKVLMRNLTKGDAEEICKLMNWWHLEDDRVMLLSVEALCTS